MARNNSKIILCDSHKNNREIRENILKITIKNEFYKKEKKNGQVDKMKKQEHNGMNPRKVYDRKDEDDVSEN